MTACPRNVSTTACRPIRRGARLRATLAPVAIVAIVAGLPLALNWVDLTPVLQAPLAIQLHLLAVAGAIALTGVLMLGVKGSRLHRALGWTWSVFMVTAAASALFIRSASGLPSVAGFGPLHLFAGIVLVAVPRAVLAARRHNVPAHARAMSAMVAGALGIAGLFAFLPGRLLWRVMFG